MPEEKNKAEEFIRSQEGSKSHGPQGVDKAPGEERSTDFENVVQDTQRAKNKVDGDPSKPEDQPKNE